MKKLFIKLDEQGCFLCDELITDLAQLHMANPSNVLEVKDAEGNIVVEEVTLERVLDSSYVDPKECPVVSGLHLPKFENGYWVEGKIIDTVKELAGAKELKNEELNLACKNEIEAGFLFNDDLFTFTRDVDQLNMTQDALLFVMNPTYVSTWKVSKSTKTIDLNFEQYKVFIATAEAHKRSQLSRCWELKKVVDESTDIDLIKEISWSVE